MNKIEEKSLQEKKQRDIRKAFVEEMRRRMLKLGINEKTFAKMLNYKDDTWRKMLSDVNKNIPIEIVSKLSKGVDDESNSLMVYWTKLALYRKNKSIASFILMKEECLLWIANNYTELLNLSEANLLFIDILYELNDEGKKRLKKELKYFDKYLQMEKRNNTYEMEFVSEMKYKYKTRLDCYQIIESWTEFWKIYSREQRKTMIACWVKLYEMDNESKKIFDEFNKYGNAMTLDASKEQIVCITIGTLLAKDEKYARCPIG